MRVLNAASSAKAARSKSQKSVSKQIDAAWFPQVLASATAATSSKSNEQEQSMLTDYFRRKPNGPAERAAADKAAREKEFANAVFKQRRDSRKANKAGSSLDVLSEGDDDDIEAEGEDGLQEPAAVSFADVAEVEDSDMEDDDQVELESQSKNDARLPCEGWVLGQKRHKTPTPVKQYRYRQF
ncbi:hypothetical protein P389DRAFT_169172 [Cystobasidium minutum MCA 4210]|uniref:uncharacterized protein n=1 Tax=Cystobasidium minutum MCA 4210 TaxID=1397322 RepID=UPI0034CD5572|eukprot:jgi/Rhomi1/169172/fgenesh1_kg.3_\